MKTPLEMLNESFIEIKELLRQYLLEHSRIEYRPLSSTRWPLVNIAFSDYSWIELDNDGKQRQAQLYKAYNKLMDLCKVFVSDLPPHVIEEFNANEKVVLDSIEQNKTVWDRSTQEVYTDVENSLDTQLKILQTIHDSKTGDYIFVPDTNALLTNPQLESWSFLDVDKFELLILPTVSAELDNLKIFHHNEAVRDKARSLINRMKDLRRRGCITEGVNLVKGKITLRALAVEPKFDNTFSWLQADNNDDRIIASFVEVMKQHPHSKVCLVTADINLQNKAEFARLSFVEPPERA